MAAAETCACLINLPQTTFVSFAFYFLIYRCVLPDSGSTTVMWPILCQSTEVLRGWAFLTGNWSLSSLVIHYFIVSYLDGGEGIEVLDRVKALHVHQNEWISSSSSSSICTFICTIISGCSSLNVVELQRATGKMERDRWVQMWPRSLLYLNWGCWGYNTREAPVGVSLARSMHMH